MVKVSLDIPKDIYNQLNKLSESINQNAEETINEILDAVTFDLRSITESEKIDIIQHSLRYLISRQLTSARLIDNSLFKKVLKELDAEGLFRVSDMTLDLDDNSIWIHFDGLKGNNLVVHSLDVIINGLTSLKADYMVEVDEEDYETKWKVEEHAKRIMRTRTELPEEFHELDPWEISVGEQEMTFFSLRVEFSEPSLVHLPSIPAISKLFEKILVKAGVSKSL